MKYCNLPSYWVLWLIPSSPIILLFALLVLHQTRTRTSHTHTWRHNSIIPVKKNFHDYYICRKTWKLFFMTIAYTVKLGNFKKLIICIVRYIKYLVEKQGCKQWTINPIFMNLSLCFVLLWCVCLTLWALLCVVTAYLCSK